MNDIQEATKLKTTSINISLPVSDIQIETLGKTREWVLRQLVETTKYASDHFSHSTVGAQDATRGNIHFLKEYIYYAQESGANRVRIADTVGISTPLEIQKLFLDLTTVFQRWNLSFTVIMI